MRGRRTDNDITVEEYIKNKPSWQGPTHFEMTGEGAKDFVERIYKGLNPLLALQIINDYGTGPKTGGASPTRFSNRRYIEMWRTPQGKLGPEDTDSALINETAEKYLKDRNISRSTKIADALQGHFKPKFTNQIQGKEVSVTEDAGRQFDGLPF